jgi:hypothetical protein
MSTKFLLRLFSSLLLAGLLLSLTKPGVAQFTTPGNNIAAAAKQENPNTKIETKLLTRLL